jgi:rhodanese-related sulfurtransferase
VTQSADSLSRFPVATYEDVRARLLARDELALIDVREEDPYAQGHPLWAANLPLSKLELDAWTRIPRRDTPIVVFGEAGGEDLAPRAAEARAARLHRRARARRRPRGLARGRRRAVHRRQRAEQGVRRMGRAERHTPSLSAEEVQALIDAQADVVIVDARRYDEYQTMNIPTSTSVPGAELVLRVRALAPNPATQVVVNCAGARAASSARSR